MQQKKKKRQGPLVPPASVGTASTSQQNYVGHSQAARLANQKSNKELAASGAPATSEQKQNSFYEQFLKAYYEKSAANELEF